MRSIVVGLVTIVLLASCTDDPTVSGPPTQAQPTQVQPTQAAAIATAEPEPTAVEAADNSEASEIAEDGDNAEAAEDSEAADNDELFPTVVDATASISNGDSWRFNVTLLSEYDSPERYADAWRVLDADDNELGIRVLGHDHANEQPFTRSHTVDVPTDLTTVFIEGRDQLNGWSGERFELTLTR